MQREWKTGPAPEPGWYVVTGDPAGRDAGDWRSYWNGREWRGFAHFSEMSTRAVIGYPVESALHFAERIEPQPRSPL